MCITLPNIIPDAILGDIIDYDELRTGTRSEALCAVTLILTPTLTPTLTLTPPLTPPLTLTPHEVHDGGDQHPAGYRAAPHRRPALHGPRGVHLSRRLRVRLRGQLQGARLRP